MRNAVNFVAKTRERTRSSRAWEKWAQKEIFRKNILKSHSTLYGTTHRFRFAWQDSMHSEMYLFKLQQTCWNYTGARKTLPFNLSNSVRWYTPCIFVVHAKLPFYCHLGWDGWLFLFDAVSGMLLLSCGPVTQIFNILVKSWRRMKCALKLIPQNTTKYLRIL